MLEELKKVVYIGHEYHKKTQSTKFLIDMLKSKFEVDVFYYNENTRKFSSDSDIPRKKYDALVLFQMPVPIDLLKKKFKFSIANYFPMYDGTGEATDDFWAQYKDFNIINFSKTLHLRLKNMGFSSFYIQYFPKPNLVEDWGELNKVFFWQRREKINIKYMDKILDEFKTKKLHMHISPDPGEDIIKPNVKERIKYDFTFSNWFETKEEMISKIESCSIYIAPRLYEGIGMSFLEAMALGRCVIAVDNPTMNEYICSGITGYLYNLDKPVVHGVCDIREIQRNTLEYIEKGYEIWEREKSQILDWIFEDPAKNSDFSKKKIKNTRKKYKKLGITILGKDYFGKLFIFNIFPIPLSLSHFINSSVRLLRKGRVRL